MFEFGKSLPASKLRMVGRGGSGSKLRQVSVSNPIVVLEADNLAQRQPVDHGGSFHRPTGRGGLGSLSTSPPAALKPPSAILDRFLRGRKPSEGRRHSVHSFDGSMLQNIHPEVSEHASAGDKDSNSYIEETLRQTSDEHRERSLNKLTRTLGVPLTTMEESQTSKSPIFDNLSTADKLIGSTRTRRTHRKWDSFESHRVSYPMTFASPSIASENAPHSDSAPGSDADSNFTTTSREDHSTQSHCLAESSASPHLHVSTHSTSDLVSNDDVPPDSNGAVGKSDWLVPLNEVVISIKRTAPSKPQSWTGEWNREMKDVIRDLRRL